MSNKRNSSLELLRILSMLSIVAFHATRTFPSSVFYSITTINHLEEVLLGSWGVLGVYIFVIISAWFLEKQQFKAKRFIKVYFEYATYVLFFCLFDSYMYQKPLQEAAYNFIYYISKGIEGGGYWFIRAYLVMYFVSPALNKLSDYKNIGKVIVLLSFIPLYCNFGKNAGGILGDIASFIYLYLVTVYIKRHNIRIKNAGIYAVLIMVMIVFLIMLDGFININALFKHELYKTLGHYDRGSFLLMVLGYLIFMVFVDMKPFTNKFINYIASFSLGVYCFHESTVFNLVDYIGARVCVLGLVTNANFLYSFPLLILVITTMGIIFEFFRRLLLQKPFDYLLDKYINLDKIDNFINSI